MKDIPAITKIASRHLGTGEGNQQAAAYVFKQADYHDEPEPELRLLRSLVYSVGIRHHDYIAAFRLVFGPEATVRAV